jgi:hypothetical protein
MSTEEFPQHASDQPSFPVSHKKKSSFQLNPPLLPGERRSDFQILFDNLSNEIMPRGLIEEIYLYEITWLVWEAMRLRQCKAPIFRANYCAALQPILDDLLRKKNTAYPDVVAEKLALNWFTDKEAKREARSILREFGLTESDVDAEAIRRSLREIEGVDKLLMGVEARRDKALRSIEKHRLSLAQRMRETLKRVREFGGHEETYG